MQTQTDTKTLQRINFIEAGYDVIPLHSNSKLPLRDKWEKRLPVTQWYKAPTDSNLGLRAGNERAFIDCDEKNKQGTFENVIHWLDSLGYNRDGLPIVQTPTKGGIGRHIYVNFTGALFGSYRNFNSTMGKGEFRYGSASYVATFPDVIAEGEYKLLQGDITKLPTLDIRDIAKLVDINTAAAESKQSKRASPLALAIMQGVNPDNRYGTNSDGEMALVLSLHNSGFAYEEIKRVFENNPCLGHYAKEHKAQSAKEAERWLSLTYKNALAYSQNESKARRILARWIERANAAAWNNINDKNLYLAHAGIAYKAARFEYAAAVRDLSLDSGLGLPAVSNGNKRLETAGRLTLVKSSVGVYSNVYKLSKPPVCQKRTHPLFTCEDVLLNGTPSNGTKEPRISQNDAFMNGGGRSAKGRLGRRAGEVYELLMSEAMTFEGLRKRTGIKTRTLRRVLSKLRKVVNYRTGEVIEMVTLGVDGGYYANLVDLDVIAALMNSYGATGKRQRDYTDDRRLRARRWELDTLKKSMEQTR